MGTDKSKSLEERTVTVLSRYITLTCMRILGLSVSAFVTIYLLIDFLEKISKFTQAHADPLDILLFFLYKTPSIVNQVIPLAVLMSTLLTLGILSRSSEIVAMQSCGISLRKIAAPLLWIAFILSLLTFFSNEAIIPETSQRMKYIEQVVIRGKNPNTFFRLNNIWYREANYVLQARLFIPEQKTLKGVTLWQTTDDMQPVRRLAADEGTWNGTGWTLKNAVEVDFSDGAATAFRKLPVVAVRLNLQINDLKVWDKHADDMGFFNLRRYTEKLRRGGYDATRFLAQMHAKISFPFASLIMAFVGIPFALRGGRSSGIAVGIGLSLAIGFAYFILNAVLLSFGQTGILPPVVSAWAANFIFALSAIWLTLTLHH
jgi:lipopolysaccharide export system permease protein